MFYPLATVACKFKFWWKTGNAWLIRCDQRYSVTTEDPKWLLIKTIGDSLRFTIQPVSQGFLRKEQYWGRYMPLWFFSKQLIHSSIKLLGCTWSLFLSMFSTLLNSKTEEVLNFWKTTVCKLVYQNCRLYESTQSSNDRHFLQKKAERLNRSRKVSHSIWYTVNIKHESGRFNKMEALKEFIFNLCGQGMSSLSSSPECKLSIQSSIYIHDY